MGLRNLFGLTHTGSWGTPELGITEAINKGVSKITGYQAPTSLQRGSQLFASPTTVQTHAVAKQPQTNTLSYTPVASSNQSMVLGAITDSGSAPAPQSSTTGGSVGGGSVAPAPNQAQLQAQQQAEALAQAKAQQEAQINNAYSDYQLNLDWYINKLRIENAIGLYKAVVRTIMDKGRIGFN